MRCSASSTDAGRREGRTPDGPACTRGTRTRSAFERGVARLLVAAIVSLTPATGYAGEEFESADQAVMLTPGEIDNSQSELKGSALKMAQLLSMDQNQIHVLLTLMESSMWPTVV